MRKSRSVVIVAVVAVALATAGGAFAVSVVDNKQANQPQVAGDANSNTTAKFPTNKQNEPTIAVNPLDNRFLIAGANDEQRQPPCGPGPVRGATAPTNDCSFFPGVATDGVYLSSDGGATWTNRGLLDEFMGAPNVVTDGDPVIAYGPKPDGHGGFTYASGARAYYASLATISTIKGFEQIIVSHSDDNGLTWSPPALATTKSSSADFNDKNWIAVDANAASPFFGRVYMSYTEFRSKTATGFGNEPTMVAVSTDGGNSFGAPNQLSPAANNGTGNGRQGTSTGIGPDGTVYVGFEQGPFQVLVVSRDGGASFTRPITISGVRDLDDPIPGANFRDDSFPTIAADPRAASTTVYASWATKTPAGGRVVVSTSNDRGATWRPPVTVSGSEGYAFFQGLAVAPNGRVDIAYQALTATNPTTFGTGNAKIDAYAASKPPNSSTWSTPSKISSASSDPSASAQNNLMRQFWGDYNTLVSTTTGGLFIATDSRNGVGCPAVDAYQRALIAAGVAIPEQDVQPAAPKGGGATLPTKPSPPTDCPAQFGNTDVVVYRFTP